MNPVDSTPQTISSARAAGGPTRDEPQLDVELTRDIAVVPEKEEAQSKDMPTEGVPPSPSAMEHLNIRSGVRGAADRGKREDSGAEDLKAGTDGVGEGATVSHLPDAGPRHG